MDTVPTDDLIIASIHLTKLIVTLVRENHQQDSVIDKLEESKVLEQISRFSFVSKQEDQNIIPPTVVVRNRQIRQRFLLSCE
jgi:hypothetical protein